MENSHGMPLLYDLWSKINVQGFLDFSGNLLARKPNKSQIK